MDEKAVSGRKAIFGATYEHNFVDVQKPASSLQFRWCLADGWKLIVPAPRLGKDAKTELFHIEKDPYEKDDLAAKMPEKVEALRKLLDGWWAGGE